MKIHRFLVSGELSTGALTIEDKELYNQIRNVLKLAVGERVIIFNGTGIEAAGSIAEIGKKGVTLEITEVYKNSSESKRKVRLYLAILKNEHFELAVQKAVECGVSEIIPVITNRTVKLGLKPERTVKIMREAAEQSGRGVVPVLREPLSFEDALKHANENDENFFCDGRAKQSGLKAKGERVGVWIGPEGGFSPEELAGAEAAKFQSVSLGELTLRAETAAIVATYLAAH